MTQTAQATPTKLRDGSWGARVQGTAAIGDTIQITTRSGKGWRALVQRVLWTGDGVAICATSPLDREARTPTAPRRHHSGGSQLWEWED